MSELSLSDQLDRMELEDIEEGAKAAIEAMKKSLTNSYEHMIRVGHFLNAMKAKLPHGAWGPWLQENFDDSRQWAHKLMTCAADRANVKSTLQMTTVSTIEQHYSMLMNTPEKQARKAEREAKKLETLPKPPAPAPATTTPPAKLERPAWLADPDELERPEEDDLPPLPRTNTHHTAANRRTPDARETDRIGIVPPDDPRTYHDGHWYEWNEDRGRMVAVTDEEILRRADEIRE